MCEDGNGITTYAAAKVIKVDPPLIMLKGGAFMGGDEVILNTASLAFVMAELMPDDHSPVQPPEKPSVIVGKL